MLSKMLQAYIWATLVLASLVWLVESNPHNDVQAQRLGERDSDQLASVEAAVSHVFLKDNLDVGQHIFENILERYERAIEEQPLSNEQWSEYALIAHLYLFFAKEPRFKRSTCITNECSEFVKQDCCLRMLFSKMPENSTTESCLLQAFKSLFTQKKYFYRRMELDTEKAARRLESGIEKVELFGDDGHPLPAHRRHQTVLSLSLLINYFLDSDSFKKLLEKEFPSHHDTDMARFLSLLSELAYKPGRIDKNAMVATSFRHVLDFFKLGTDCEKVFKMERSINMTFWTLAKIAGHGKCALLSAMMLDVVIFSKELVNSSSKESKQVGAARFAAALGPVSTRDFYYMKDLKSKFGVVQTTFRFGSECQYILSFQYENAAALKQMLLVVWKITRTTQQYRCFVMTGFFNDIKSTIAELEMDGYDLPKQQRLLADVIIDLEFSSSPFYLDQQAQASFPIVLKTFNIDSTCKWFGSWKKIAPALWTLAIMAGYTDCIPNNEEFPKGLKIALRQKSGTSLAYMLARMTKKFNQTKSDGKRNRLITNILPLYDRILQDLVFSKIVAGPNSFVADRFICWTLRYGDLTELGKEVELFWWRTLAKHYTACLNTFVGQLEPSPEREIERFVTRIFIDSDYSGAISTSLGHLFDVREEGRKVRLTLTRSRLVKLAKYAASLTSSKIERISAKNVPDLQSNVVTFRQDKFSRAPIVSKENRALADQITGYITDSLILRFLAPFRGRPIFTKQESLHEEFLVDSILEGIHNGVFGLDLEFIAKSLGVRHILDDKPMIIATVLVYVFTRMDYTPGDSDALIRFQITLSSDGFTKEQIKRLSALVAFFWGLQDEFLLLLDRFEPIDGTVTGRDMGLRLASILSYFPQRSSSLRSLYYADKHIKGTMAILLERLGINLNKEDISLQLFIKTLVGESISEQDFRLLEIYEHDLYGDIVEDAEGELMHVCNELKAFMGRQASAASFGELDKLPGYFNPYHTNNAELMLKLMETTGDWKKFVPLRALYDKSPEIIAAVVKQLQAKKNQKYLRNYFKELMHVRDI